VFRANKVQAGTFSADVNEMNGTAAQDIPLRGGVTYMICSPPFGWGIDALPAFLGGAGK
jgi:hypothetical protein